MPYLWHLSKYSAYWNSTRKDAKRASQNVRMLNTSWIFVFVVVQLGVIWIIVNDI